MSGPGFTLAIDDRRALRLYEESDADEVYALIDANRDHLAPWMPWAAGQTLEATQQFIRAGREKLGSNSGVETALVIDGVIVGGAGVRIVPPDGNGEIGYWIGAAHEGQGMVTAGVATLISFAFDTLGLRRLEIRAGTENERSRAVPQRLGFTYEGTLRGAEKVGDRILDHAVYGLLAPEWRGAP